MHRRADTKGSDSKKKSESHGGPQKQSTSDTACGSQSHGCTQAPSRSELVRETGAGEMGTNTNNTGPSSARDALT